MRAPLTPLGGWRLAISEFGFCTMNGAWVIPRKPGPDARRVDRDEVGQVDLDLRRPARTSRPRRSWDGRSSGSGRTRCASCRCRGRGCPSLEFSERMMFRCCICLATLGRCSQISTPGPAEVAIGWKSPPFFELSGCRLQVSSWLGPPPIQSRMQLLLVLRGRLGIGLECPEELHGRHGQGGGRQVAEEVAATHPAGRRQAIDHRSVPPLVQAFRPLCDGPCFGEGRPRLPGTGGISGSGRIRWSSARPRRCPPERRSNPGWIGACARPGTVRPWTGRGSARTGKVR